MQRRIATNPGLLIFERLSLNRLIQWFFRLGLFRGRGILLIFISNSDFGRFQTSGRFPALSESSRQPNASLSRFPLQPFWDLEQALLTIV
jgi:hypothetical protein